MALDMCLLDAFA
ncbi:hypothetical protein FXE82_10615 [Vibrio cholerae]|nr:hypothetical protein [Vibrio cholerae]MBJ6938063.1 hypothetical protein [Vibrio cholerae]MBJ6965971.1 hypothetical protein [Vibrio cholerae]TXY38365.1 hypothetical protein FXE82_10615 [Vibrio cholerae]